MSVELKEKVQEYENYILANGVDERVIEAYIAASKVAYQAENDSKYGLELSKRAKELIETLVVDLTGGSIWDLEKYSQDNNVEYDLINQYYELLKMESFYRFESFIYCMERKRPYKKRFYHPRRKTLRIVVEDLQTLEDNPIKFQGISQPSRTGKSTICILFLLWIAMKRPNSHSAMGGHSGILAKGFYKELLNMMTSPEYSFQELYYYWHPEYNGKAFPTDKSADDYTITLGDSDRFATITCRGIDGTWTGAVDVSSDGYLYVDDLVRDREHSLSPTRMESTYQEYLNKMVDRKNDGSKELMVGTLWNVLDPLERIRKQYEGNSEYKFRKIPALDENDESNFDYEINGFSTTYYREMREKLANAEWMAKFMQMPYVREGILFPADELRYFDGTINLPRKSVIAVCDPAFGGADSLSMPVCYIDEDETKYIIDWVHKQGTQAVTVPLVVDKIAKHYITELHIEQNAGGKLLTDSIKQEMQKRDIRFCKIVPYYASTKMPKEEKIKAYSDWVKDNFMFLMPKQSFTPTEFAENEQMYVRSEQYQKAMNELSMYASEGKNPHDDAADVITQFAIVLGRKPKEAVVFQNFW